MRSFLRRIAIATKLFLLAAFLPAIIGLWCRSYFEWDIVSHVEPSKAESRTYTVLRIRSNKGELTFDREECLRFESNGEGSNQKERRAKKRFYYHTSSGDDPYLRGAGGETLFDYSADEWLVERFPQNGGTHWGGFEFWRFEYRSGQFPMFVSKFTRRLTLLRIPYWSVALLFLAWPAISFASTYRKHSRRARRIKNQQCLHCGYDLRASPDKCPECGTPVESQMLK